MTVPEEVKHRIATYFINSTSRYIPKELKPGIQILTDKFIAALLTIVKGENIKYLSIGEEISKIQYKCTIKYYSALKRNKVLIHTTTAMSLESITLS